MALAEELSSVPSTHTVIHNCLYVQFQSTVRWSLWGLVWMWCTCTHIQMHTHICTPSESRHVSEVIGQTKFFPSVGIPCTVLVTHDHPPSKGETAWDLESADSGSHLGSSNMLQENWDKSKSLIFNWKKKTKITLPILYELWFNYRFSQMFLVKWEMLTNIPLVMLLE